AWPRRRGAARVSRPPALRPTRARAHPRRRGTHGVEPGRHDGEGCREARGRDSAAGRRGAALRRGRGAGLLPPPRLAASAARSLSTPPAEAAPPRARSGARDALELAVFRGIAGALALLPRRAAARFGGAILRVYARLAPSRRRILAKNLRAAFPDA